MKLYNPYRVVVVKVVVVDAATATEVRLVNVVIWLLTAFINCSEYKCM
ncbi:MAG: hypothetical protein ACO28V_08460 [Chitinophagaceae bacterium]